jgi:hypothetical protein
MERDRKPQPVGAGVVVKMVAVVGAVVGAVVEAGVGDVVQVKMAMVVKRQFRIWQL